MFSGYLEQKLKVSREIFIDTANVQEIKRWKKTGIIGGVTTNQAILLKDSVRPEELRNHIKLICLLVKKPVSVELTDSKSPFEEMIEEAQRLREIDEAVVIKVPLIPETTKSLDIIAKLCELSIPVNVTCMMSFEQMIVATLATREARQAYISLFWARSIEDHDKYRSSSEWIESHPKVGPEGPINSSPNSIVAATATFIREGGFSQPKIIIGSIRNARQVGEAFTAGAHIVTVTPDVLNAMLDSERTIETIKQFDDAWEQLTGINK